MKKSIKILGREIKIKVGKNLFYEGKPVLGLCDYDNRTIYLEKNQNPESLRDTLVHEAAHYFLILTGIDQRLSDSECEVYCQLLAAFVRDLR